MWSQHPQRNVATHADDDYSNHSEQTPQPSPRPPPPPTQQNHHDHGAPSPILPHPQDEQASGVEDSLLQRDTSLFSFSRDDDDEDETETNLNNHHKDNDDISSLLKRHDRLKQQQQHSMEFSLDENDTTSELLLSRTISQDDEDHDHVAHIPPPSPLPRPSPSLLDDEMNIPEPQEESQDEEDRLLDSILASTPRNHHKKHPARSTTKSSSRNPGPTGRPESSTTTSTSDNLDLLPVQEVHVNNPNNNHNPMTTDQPSLDAIARVHGNALQALQRLKEQLTKSELQVQALQADKEQLLNEKEQAQKDKDDTASQEMIAALKQQLHEQTERQQVVEQKLREAHRDKKDALHKRVAAENRATQLGSQLRTVQTQLSTSQEHAQQLETRNQELQSQLEAIQTQLEQSSTHDQKLEQHHQEEMQRLTAQLQSKDEALACIKSDQVTLERNWKQELESTQQSSQRRIQALEQALRESNAALQQSQQQAKLSPTTNHHRVHDLSLSTDATNHPTHTATATSTLETSIADRLAKIRDSADRANLVRLHQRALAKQKAESTAQLQKTKSEHEQALQTTIASANAKLQARLSELKASLQADYDDKVSALEAQYRTKLTEVCMYIICAIQVSVDYDGIST